MVGVATGERFPDALAGGAHIGRRGGPLILTLTPELPEVAHDYLFANAPSIASGFVYGGATVVSDSVLTEVQNAISGVS